MPPFHLFRLLALAAAMLCAGTAFAQEPNFCAPLKRVIGEKAKGFAPLRVKPYHGSTKEWDARINLPGTQFCRVDAERKNYNCWITGLSKTWTLDGAAKLKAKIVSCIGEPSVAEKTDDFPDTTRSIVAWENEGASVELITRIGKQEQGKQTPLKHSVFVYVR